MNSVNPVLPAKNKSRQHHHEYTICPTAKLGLLSREATSRSPRRHHCSSSASRHSLHRFEQETPGSVFWEQTTNKLLDLHVLNSA